MKLVDTIEFDCELIREGSWGHEDIGMQHSTMCLYITEKADGPGEWGNTGGIEWTTDKDEYEYIGLWWKHNFDTGRAELTDYDGIMGYLPTQAVELLKRNGIDVPPGQYFLGDDDGPPDDAD